jgi:signal transduction histidine kinase/Fe-S-cluster-containing hydrogenase component 2
MMTQQSLPFITTIHDRCRRCYTCVRECPAKAIRIAGGQADVVADRCIGCGNCVRVCSQNAKRVLSSIPEVWNLLESGRRVAVCLAPSFPAEFEDIPYSRLAGMIRALGFHGVYEVGFGADLVARKMRELIEGSRQGRFISTACPAVFGYVKRYHPELIDSLAPLVSPMIATARMLRNRDPEIRVVFIGPCISKKIEATSGEVAGEVDEVLTFAELRQMFRDRSISPEAVVPCDFDPPHPAMGGLFPIGRGLLEASDIKEDFMTGDVISANGRATFIDAVVEFSNGELDAKLLDVLCCDGCIMGSGMTTNTPLFKRRAAVGRYVREASTFRDAEAWREAMDRYDGLNLWRNFYPYDQRITVPDHRTIQRILLEMGKEKPEDELNCGACGYDTCRGHAVAIHEGLAECEMCLPYSIDQLHRTIGELNRSNEELADAKEALIQSEKMASMGQLAAGIAHEVNNPLGVVLMYAHLLREELTQDRAAVGEELQMIVDHADRAKKIVSGLLHFARQNKVIYKPVNLIELVEDCRRPVQIPETIRVEVENRMIDPVVELDRDQIIQVVNNLISNSVTAMPDGGTLRITLDEENKGTFVDGGKTRIAVSDTGTGIPAENLKKIFEPFFTTKQIGKGTGLGLAIAYGIVKMHRGDIRVESNADPAAGPTGTAFTIILPRKETLQPATIG